MKPISPMGLVPDRLTQLIQAGQAAYSVYVHAQTFLQSRKDRTVYSIGINDDDAIYPEVHRWLLAQVSRQATRSLTAFTIRQRSDDYDYDPDEYDDQGQPRQMQRVVRYQYSGDDALKIVIGGHPITAWLDKSGGMLDDEDGNKKTSFLTEKIVLTATSEAGRQAVMDVLTTLSRLLEKKREPRVLVAASWGRWSIANSGGPRDPSTVVLDGDQLERLNEDLTQFLAQQKWYSSRGLPWHRGYLLFGPPGTGKAQPLDAKVLTPSGWKTMGDLHLFDEVIGSDGRSMEVTGVYPQGEKQIYRLTLSDGSSVEATGEHLWLVQTHDHRSDGHAGYVRSTDEIRQELLQGSERAFYLPQMAPAQFAVGEDLPIHPYLLGLLLGDGSLRSKVEFCSIDAELIERFKALVPPEVHCTTWGKSSSPDLVVIGCRKKTKTGGWGGQGKSVLAQHLIDLGLLGLMSTDKFIPEIYLRSSVENRLALLQGLMDTDGGAERTAAVFYSSSEKLVHDVSELVELLGGTACVSSRIPTYGSRAAKLNGKRAYNVSIRLPSGMCPFQLTRKITAWSSRPHNPPVRSIVSVEPTRTAEAQCISVEAQDHLYTTEHGILTHNSSLARVLAAGHGMDLYYLPLSDIEDDKALMTLISGVPERSILLLEDIDTVHAAVSREDDKPGLSAGGLLNALDGVATPHGLVTVMTTNNKHLIDEALVRRGRCDVEIEIGYLTDNQAVKLAAVMTGIPGPLPALNGRQLAPADLVELVKTNSQDMQAARAAIIDLLREEQQEAA